MKTITPILWSRLTKNKEKKIFIRVTENRKSKYKSLGIEVKPNLWNTELKRVSKKHPDHESLNEIIDNEVDIIRKKDIQRKYSKSYLDYHKNHKDYLKDDQKFGSYKKFNTVYKHLETFIEKLGKTDITFDDIDKDFLKKLKSHFTKRKIGKNSQKTYFKQIKYLLKEAIKEGNYSPILPLDTIFPKIKSETPKPTSLSKVELLKIINQKTLFDTDTKDLHNNINLLNTINYFLFSFFSLGMRFSDLCRLKWGNIEGDIKNQKIHYKMIKTDHEHKFSLFTPLVEILRFFLPTRFKIIYLQNINDIYLYNYLTNNEKKLLRSGSFTGVQNLDNNTTFYSKSGKNNKINIKELIESKQSRVDIVAIRKFISIICQKSPNEYIFPILRKTEREINPDEFYKLVESKLTIYNHNLGRIKERCGITKKLTSHVARHTFSFLSLKEGASVFEISTSLNHQDLSTTQSYLRGDSSFVDESISEIYEKMFSKQKK